MAAAASSSDSAPMSIQRSKAFSSRARISLPSLTPLSSAMISNFVAVMRLVQPGHQDGGGLLAEFAATYSRCGFSCAPCAAAGSMRRGGNRGISVMAPDARAGLAVLRVFRDGLEDEGLHHARCRRAPGLQLRLARVEIAPVGAVHPHMQHFAQGIGMIGLQRQCRAPDRPVPAVIAACSAIRCSRDCSAPRHNRARTSMAPAIAFDRLVEAPQVAQHIAAAVPAPRHCAAPAAAPGRSWPALPPARPGRAAPSRDCPRLPRNRGSMASARSRLASASAGRFRFHSATPRLFSISALLW